MERNKTPQLEIRPVQAGDMKMLIQLCAEHAAYEKTAFSQTDKLESLSGYLFSKASPIRCQVVANKETLVGYMTYMKQFSTWDAAYYVYMDCLYLRPEVRNIGIGKNLMKRLADFAKSENCNKIQWQTPASNLKAIRFYQRRGADSKSKERFFLSADND